MCQSKRIHLLVGGFLLSILGGACGGGGGSSQPDGQCNGILLACQCADGRA
jgi:hypothetical protein